MATTPAPSYPGAIASEYSVSIKLILPVIFLVLAATAIPVEFRLPEKIRFAFSSRIDDSVDILLNIVGYLPVGIVLREFGPLRAIVLAGLLSMLAETSQVVMMHREPSLVDVVSNVGGAALGSLVRSLWNDAGL